METLCFQSFYFQLKNGPGKVQNVQWLSHKNMPISQTECNFKSPWHRFLGEPILFLLALKRNL